jgi:hypothetical protein
LSLLDNAQIMPASYSESCKQKDTAPKGGEEGGSRERRLRM